MCCLTYRGMRWEEWTISLASPSFRCQFAAKSRLLYNVGSSRAALEAALLICQKPKVPRGGLDLDRLLLSFLSFLRVTKSTFLLSLVAIFCYRLSRLLHALLHCVHFKFLYRKSLVR